MIIHINDLNPIEKMVINKVKKSMKEKGVKILIIAIDDNDEITFEHFSEPIKALTITQVNELLKQLPNGNQV